MIEIIDSPIPLLIGMLGNLKLAKTICDMRERNGNIILIHYGKVLYYNEEKINFKKDCFDDLYLMIKKNYSEFKINLADKQKNISNTDLIYEKMYKNIFGSIQNLITKKIDTIADKYKNKLIRNSFRISALTLKTEELEVRNKIKNDFVKHYQATEENNFYKCFSQTQIFASYLDSYIELMNKK